MAKNAPKATPVNNQQRPWNSNNIQPKTVQVSNPIFNNDSIFSTRLTKLEDLFGDLAKKVQILSDRVLKIEKFQSSTLDTPDILAFNSNNKRTRSASPIRSSPTTSLTESNTLLDNSNKKSGTNTLGNTNMSLQTNPYLSFGTITEFSNSFSTPVKQNS